jgi:hypothetical protein
MLSPAQIRAQVTAIRKGMTNGSRAIAISAPSAWTGPDHLEIGGVEYTVVSCQSDLHVRAVLLRSEAEQQPYILVCHFDAAHLADDVLAQRLHTDFETEARFDNPRAPQVRLQAFDLSLLMAVGRKVRDLYASGSAVRERVLAVADDALIEALAKGVAGRFGGRIGIAPRTFLKKLVADLLDRIELHSDFDPRRDYRLLVREEELTEEERNLAPADSVNEIALKL